MKWRGEVGWIWDVEWDVEWRGAVGWIWGGVGVWWSWDGDGIE